MQSHPADEVSYLKQIWDKLVRKATGKYQEVQQIEIDRIQAIYLAHFSQLPEILQLGENYSNRLELSTQGFKLEYWTKQLKGYFYNQAEHFINIMCSYEISKMNKFLNGYTDDSVHLLFNVLKQWAVSLSNTHYDQNDINEARKYQLFIKDLITQNVFKPTNDDSRVQVLFSLEEILRTEIIPYLLYYRENKSAQEQLKTVSGHLEKFFNHAIKYLFYIARDSQYVPNISYRKILSLNGDKNYPPSLNLTVLETNKWEEAKDTLPLKWLTQLIRNDLTMFNQIRPLCITNSTSTELVENNQLRTNDFTNVSSQLNNLPFDYKKNKFPAHIDLRTYVNIHAFLQEVIYFRMLFSSAEQCAEMGGNLLAFGLLRGELSESLFKIYLIC